MKQQGTQTQRRPWRADRTRPQPAAAGARPSLLDTLPKAAACTLLGVALLDGMGAVIVGAFYGSFGIPLLSIPASRYLAAAVGFLVWTGRALVLGALVGMTLVRVAERRLPPVGEHPRRPLVVFADDLFMGIGYLVLLLATMAVAQHRPGRAWWRVWVSGSAEPPLASAWAAEKAFPYFLFGLGLGAALITYALVLGVRRRVSSVALGVFVAAGISWLVVGCYTYGATQYGHRLPSMGGGRPASARFYVNAAAAEMLRDSAPAARTGLDPWGFEATPIRSAVAGKGAESSDAATRNDTANPDTAAGDAVYVTSPLEVLEEDKDSYYVLLPAPRVWQMRCVRLPKASTTGLRFLTRDEQDKYYWRPTVTLGPKPAIYAAGGAHANMGSLIDGIRDWLAFLPTPKAEYLQRRGPVTFSYRSLQNSDAAHAQLIARYANGLRTSMEPEFRARGKEVPAFVPAEVSFVRSGPGAYELAVTFVGMSDTKRVLLSDPIEPAKPIR